MSNRKRYGLLAAILAVFSLGLLALRITGNAVIADSEPHGLSGPMAAIPTVPVLPPCEFRCPPASIPNSQCTLQSLTDKYGPPEKLYVTYNNRGTIEQLDIHTEITLLYPSKGLGLHINGGNLSELSDQPPLLDKNMIVTGQECYPPTTLEEYMGNNKDIQQVSHYWTNFVDWPGFEK